MTAAERAQASPVAGAGALAAMASAFDLAEGDLEDLAERAAEQVRGFAELWQAHGTDDGQAMLSLRRIARRHKVELPAKDGFQQVLNRLASPAWWRRALRKRYRVVERHQIAIGAVHRQASPYVSAKALRRHERNVRRLAELLASMEALNLDTGEAIPLEELAEKSQANPAMRRMAMMARIRGVEAHAKAKGDEAHFVTVTTPSRMHAYRTDGIPNPSFDGTEPRQAQAYLSRVWKNAMRAARHAGLHPYGLRTVEPHHDACPHWHLLVFTPAGQGAPFLRILQAHALADSPDERGAAEHRFTAKPIDPAKGSVAGYVAKYVAKSIDGHGVAADDESEEDGAGAAKRIVAWARHWGIRQFQFFGLPAITPTRELYRHSGEGLGSQALEEAHRACKAKDYAGYLAALEAHGLALRVDYEEHPSTRYAGELAHAIRGLRASGGDLAELRVIVTRGEQWVIQPRPGSNATAGADAPWTRFNNCAGPDASSTYARDQQCAGDQPEARPREGRRRRPDARLPQALCAA